MAFDGLLIEFGSALPVLLLFFFQLSLGRMFPHSMADFFVLSILVGTVAAPSPLPYSLSLFVFLSVSDRRRAKELVPGSSRHMERFQFFSPFGYPDKVSLGPGPSNLNLIRLLLAVGVAGLPPPPPRHSHSRSPALFFIEKGIDGPCPGLVVCSANLS